MLTIEKNSEKKYNAEEYLQSLLEIDEEVLWTSQPDKNKGKAKKSRLDLAARIFFLLVSIAFIVVPYILVKSIIFFSVFCLIFLAVGILLVLDWFKSRDYSENKDYYYITNKRVIKFYNDYNSQLQFMYIKDIYSIKDKNCRAEQSELTFKKEDMKTDLVFYNVEDHKYIIDMVKEQKNIIRMQSKSAL